MFFIVNSTRQAGRLATVFGPFETQAEAELAIMKMQPGVYQIFGPSPEGKRFTVAVPVITEESPT